MRNDSSLINGLLTSGNPLKYGNPPIECLKRIYVDKVGCRLPVLRNQDGFVVLLETRDYFRGFTFEGGHQLSSHEVIL